VLFGAVPLNLTTKRTVHLENTGDCHAYFQVRRQDHTTTVKGIGIKLIVQKGLLLLLYCVLEVNDCGYMCTGLEVNVD